VVNLVNGMGYAFDKVGLKGTIVYYIAVALYRNALAMPGIRVIFQNPTDRQYFIDHKLVDESKTVLIRGSGVDMKKFTPEALPTDEKPTVLFVGRLLWSKGIQELVDAAQLIRQNGIAFRLMIVGEPDERNPGAVPRAFLEEWHKNGVIDWVGRQTDMPSFYRKADIVCLPTKYREGLPLTLLEAASMGRPLVATDMPGCREAVISGLNGFLVPIDNAVALADALGKLLSDRSLREKMGRASSQLVEDEFSSEHVKRQLLAVYDSLYSRDADWNTASAETIYA
jgi:glycosyltransferase involved in cell wall biosynthesis